MKPVSTDPFAGEGPDFNADAARMVYGQIMKMDCDSAVVFSRMVVGGLVQRDLIVHHDQIAETVSKVLAERTDLVRKQLMRTSIAKARAGEDNTEELAALVELSKGFFGSLFSHFARSQRTEKQKRDPSGRFEVMHEQVHVPAGAEEMSRRYADKLNIPPIPNATHATMTPAERAHFQHAYMQVERMLRPYTELPKDSGIVTFHYQDAPSTWQHLDGDKPLTVLGTIAREKKDDEGKVIVGADGKPEIEEVAAGKHGIDPTKKLTAITLDVAPKVDAQGGVFAALNSIGMPRFGAMASGAMKGGALDPKRLNEFDQTWNRNDPEDQFTPSNRVFRRLESGSSLLEDTMGSTAPPQAKMAMRVAQHVGRLGPSAHKLISPTLDRAAYRYRGTERKIDPKLLRAQDTLDAEVERRSGYESRLKAIAAEQRLALKGEYDRAQRIANRRKAQAEANFEQASMDLNSGRISEKDYRRAAMKAREEKGAAERDLNKARAKLGAGVNEAQLREKKGGEIRRATTLSANLRGYEANGEWEPGAVLEYFKHRVPSPELNELQLKSGVVPPSEGVIIGEDGKIKVQTLGYGDDHYLPFTLRNLAKLRGGYYIRTRTFGGPTTEDIYTALISGARGLTVVSNNGVYNVEFDKEFKHGRRWNDKAARMVARYGSLLDAVKMRQVGGGEIAPSRMRELYDKAAQQEPYDATARKAARDRLVEQERADPTLSMDQTQTAALDFLNAQVHSDQRMSLEQLRDYAASIGAAKLRSQTPEMPVEALPVWADRIREQIDSTPNPREMGAAIADQLGVRTGFEQAMDRADRDNRRRMLPMTLDGEGYHAALDALHQQFPYYINKPEFHPFEDGLDRIDTGYVKPNHNRPYEALAGHFDPTIGGGGKAHADSIRNNRRPKIDWVNPPAATADATGPADGASGGTGAAGGTVLSEKEKAARADRELLEHLLTFDKFADDMPANEKGKTPAGRPIRLLAVLDGVDPGLQAVWGKDKAAVLAEQRRDPEAFHHYLERAVDYVEEVKALHLDEAKVRAFRAGGKAPAITPLTDPVAALRNNPDLEHDFSADSSMFMPGSKASQDDIDKLYKRTPGITKLIAGGQLPDSPGSKDFDDAAKALATKIDTVAQDRVDWLRSPGKVGAEPKDQTNRARALLQAIQLRRRWQEAKAAAEQSEKAAPLIDPNADVHLHFNQQEDTLVVVDDKGGATTIQQPPAIEGGGGNGRSHWEEVLARLRPPKQP